MGLTFREWGRGLDAPSSLRAALGGCFSRRLDEHRMDRLGRRRTLCVAMGNPPQARTNCISGRSRGERTKGRRAVIPVCLKQPAGKADESVSTVQRRRSATKRPLTVRRANDWPTQTSRHKLSQRRRRRIEPLRAAKFAAGMRQRDVVHHFAGIAFDRVVGFRAGFFLNPTGHERRGRQQGRQEATQPHTEPRMGLGLERHGLLDRQNARGGSIPHEPRS